MVFKIGVKIVVVVELSLTYLTKVGAKPTPVNKDTCEKNKIRIFKSFFVLF